MPGRIVPIVNGEVYHIFNRLIKTIMNFNLKAEKLEKAMLFLAATQVILAITQVFLALK